jgi:hypothetical protein
MNVTIYEFLQLLTLLQIPAALAYIIRLEGRIARLEAILGAMKDAIDGHMKREESMIASILHLKGVQP